MINRHNFSANKIDKNRRHSQGFTIVELLIVVVVIAILATITIVAYNGIQSNAQKSVLSSDLLNLSKYLETQRVRSGSDTYPADLSGTSIPNGLTIQYTNYSGSSPNRYCMTGSRANFTRHIASTGAQIDGACPGHAGPQVAALDCPAGYITVPGNSYYGTSAFCVMKYEARDVSGVPTSQATGTPWITISQPSAATAATSSCTECHLITESEWLTIAANILSVPANWSGGSVGNGFVFSGHNDGTPNNPIEASTNDATGGYTNTGNSSPSNQRRTHQLTNGEYIWDFAGNVWEWTQGTIGSNQPGYVNESVFSMKEWNDPSLTWGSFPAQAKPANSFSGAGSWSSSQGIGQVYSNSGDTTLRGFRRGGNWNGGAQSGVLALLMGNSPSSTTGLVGFRVAR